MLTCNCFSVAVGAGVSLAATGVILRMVLLRELLPTTNSSNKERTSTEIVHQHKLYSNTGRKLLHVQTIQFQL